MQFILVHVIRLKNKKEKSISNARYYICTLAFYLLSHIYAVHEETGGQYQSGTGLLGILTFPLQFTPGFYIIYSL
jgi:hypothetical protein